MPGGGSQSATSARRQPAEASTKSESAADGSFVNSEVVWGLGSQVRRWRRAKIISTEIPPCLARQEIPPQSIYVHWKGYDRRWDEWVPKKNIRKLVHPPEPSNEEEVEWSEAESDDAHAGMEADYIREHEEQTKFKTLGKIRVGKYLLQAWYFSPYPQEYQSAPCLYICSFCLTFLKDEEEYSIHRSRCTSRYPPGNEIYRDADRKLSMWEVDGGISRVYCENLCFLSKLFLDHKTLRHPVNLFLFYILTEMHKDGYHIVGYFSKEKYSRNNVSCILVLPQHQKKGYGKYLINFSYALALKECRRGTPERPLSDLGYVSYMSYWRQVLVGELLKRGGTDITIAQLADELAFEPQDILATFEDAALINQETTTSTKYLHLTQPYAGILTAELGKPSAPIVVDDLHWIPYDPFLGPYEYAP